MKTVFRKLSILGLGMALIAPASVLAQQEGKDKEKKEVEEIVIVRKGDKNEKVVVEINGDKITVNGKSIEDLKEGDVTVRRNRIRDVWAYADGLRNGAITRSMSPQGNFYMLSTDSNRAMLGVTTEKAEKGVQVESITKESAAEKAGLKKEDVITKVGDKKIETPDDLSATIKSKKPGDKVDITYIREGKEQKVTAELGKWKGSNVFSTVPGQNFRLNMDDFNFNFGDMVPSTPRVATPYGVARSSGPKLGLSVQDTDNGKGVQVIGVEADGSAEKAGIKKEDVITEVDGKAVNNTDEIAKIIRDSKDKASVMMKLQRNGKTQNIEVKIPRKLKTTNL